ncbi:MAG: hypothetical protein ACRELY_31165 [Polyangiaceae bacterium]
MPNFDRSISARHRFAVSSMLKVIALAAVCACTSTHSGDDTQTPPATTTVQPVEFVGYHTEVPLTPNDFHPLASGLFGADAQGGKILPEQTIAPGLFVSSAADQQTPDQVDLTFSFDDGSGTHRKLAMTPASFQIGSLFVAAVDAALATMQGDNQQTNGQGGTTGQGESFYLEYRMYSSQGGRVSFGVRGNGGVYTWVLDITSPHMSLDPDKLNTAADHDGPYETVAGTVWFHMQKDDFDFFVGHAYGVGATGKQNFTDFALVPHDWLHLTVKPHLDQSFVDVSFDLIGTDGSRTAVANAPASVAAGTTFQAAVDRNMSNTIAAEQAKPGSSTPWSVPFYYDSPNQGGVVQVIAQGSGGLFTVAYGVETPHHPLKDVPLLQYEPVTLPPDDGAASASCQDLGHTPAPKGTLNITFQASDEVKNSPDLQGPLVGDISCSVYHSTDVHADGPIPGAVSLQDFALPGADLGSATAPTFTTNAFFSGDYQVLCFQDLNKDGNADPGDPVTLPIGSYPIECDVNPATVEFAVLYPKGG